MSKAIWLAAAALLTTFGYGATVDELKALFDQQDYPAVVREADRTLIADPSLGGSDAYATIMFKAESMLRLGNRVNAGQEFAAAARVAPALPQIAWARSTRLLIDRSAALGYIPRSGEDREPIAIIETATRKRAFAVMAEDLRPVAMRQYDAAMRATTLPELEDAITPVSDVALLEIASGGDSKQMLATLNKLGKHAQQLIAEDMLRTQRQISHLDRVASAYEDFSVGGRRGITSRDRDTLYDLQSYLDRVNERVRMYRDVAVRLGGDTSNWDQMMLQIVALQADVDSMLATRY